MTKIYEDKMDQAVKHLEVSFGVFVPAEPTPAFWTECQLNITVFPHLLHRLQAFQPPMQEHWLSRLGTDQF